MRKLILFAAIAALVVAATGAVSPAVAIEKNKAVATGQKMKLKGVVTRRDADTFTVRSKKGGKSSGGVSAEPPPSLSAADKAKKKPKKRRESVQFEDIHVSKEVDKASPKLNPASGANRPGGGKPPGGGLLDSQGGLGTTGPAGAGTTAPRGGGAAPGPVFR